jgi:CheY-like chemotaxis protein
VSRRKKVVEPAVLKAMRCKRILIVDDHAGFRTRIAKTLSQAGFESVATAAGTRSAWRHFDEYQPDLVLMDIHLEEYEGDGLDLLKAFGLREYQGLSAVVSGDQEVDQVYRALAAGADDYWVKGGYFNPVFEVIGLLGRPVLEELEKWSPENIARLGFFRTVGATPAEIEATIEYAENFDKYSSVADRTGKSYQQLRRIYSRVKQKCGCKSLSQFGRLITLCEMMGSRPAR